MLVSENAPSVGGVNADIGERFAERRIALGMSVKALAERAGIDRGRLAALEKGDNVRMTTVGQVDRALSELEHEMGMDLPSQVETIAAPTESKPGVVRVEVQGVYGAKALILEAPPENLAELKAMVDQIMRSLRDDERDSTQKG